MYLLFCVGFDTIENLYIFTNPIDLINDNYDKNTFLRLNSCVIKSTVKDSCKATIESISDYCDVNVSISIFRDYRISLTLALYDVGHVAGRLNL
jgi:hypothetical protein